jgi:hypothetical protein
MNARGQHTVEILQDEKVALCCFPLRVKRYYLDTPKDTATSFYTGKISVRSRLNG